MPPSLLSYGSGIGSGVAILLGGTVALRLTRRTDLVLGWSAGVILGVALFDLLPEAFALGGARFGAGGLLGFTAIGFIAYLLLDSATAAQLPVFKPLRAHIGAASLLLHTITDGFMVGIGFDISIHVGIVIAAAIVAHGLVHGVNSVSLVREGGGKPIAARRWVAMTAAGPLAGIAIARFVSISPPILAALLAGFAGVFLYIGPCELLPRRSGALSIPAAFLVGGAMVYAIIAVTTH